MNPTGLKLATIFVFLPLCLLAAGPDESVRQAEKAWADATMKGDAAALERVLADDLTYTHSSGRSETKAEFINALRSGAMKYEAIEYGEMKVRVYGNTAILTTDAKVKVVSRGQPNSFQLRLLHVYVKNKPGWQLTAHQSTRLTP